MGASVVADFRDTDLEVADEVAQLVERAQRGSTRAFEQLYHRRVGRVYGLCLRMMGDPEHATTLTQDAFVRAWEKLGTYRGQGSFDGWLRRLTVNVVIEDRRKAARQARWFAPEEESDRAPAAAAAPRDTEDAIDLERAISTLPPGARMAFVLHDVEGYRHREIAEMTGLASGTIKAQLHRARGLLRHVLEKGGPEH